MGRKLKAIENKINQAEKQLQEARKELADYKKAKKSSPPKIGDQIEIADMKWTVLDITEKGYLCLAERIKEDMQFDANSNDWRKSALREYLNTKFLEKVALDVGEDNVIPFERDLMSLDGQTEYDMCKDKVSLISIDEYRIYRGLIPNTDDYWWWLINPWSTPCNGYSRLVTVVSPSGYVNYFSYDFSIGVRPFCIFSSSIFESEEE